MIHRKADAGPASTPARSTPAFGHDEKERQKDLPRAVEALIKQRDHLVEALRLIDEDEACL
ncbi:hypothetical protein [Methylobacterium sp. E-066]|uniref:hypothetical protein n=1 Tax=Methylobacterium sp. E-066 TaxID=2836584 RepID=UPI001FBAC6E4|nr:hypothetical protein [Methylobacterium sp. E-066]MCJ2139341.1 hypothetical protein [Methylobacterium sp. E-066]